VGELAGLQHGVVARWQLLQLGLSRDPIQKRIDAGRLHRLHRGVYAVGHKRLSRKGRWMAAVLACGPRAVLSHRTAIALWELRPPLSGGAIDVTVPGRSRKGQKGIRVHNVRALHHDDRALVDGIPVTSVHRTLLDYAEVAQAQQLRLAIEASERRELFDLNAIDKLVARSPGRRGRPILAATLTEMRGRVARTESELERAFLALIRVAGIPEPIAQAQVAGYRVDLLWPGTRPLVVELDSYEYHKSRAKFDSDRRRDAKLQVAIDCCVLRVTWTRLEQEPRELIAEVRALLRAERAGGAGASGR
jgi:very-short-patch-repair endonuclease